LSYGVSFYAACIGRFPVLPIDQQIGLGT